MWEPSPLELTGLNKEFGLKWGVTTELNFERILGVTIQLWLPVSRRSTAFLSLLQVSFLASTLSLVMKLCRMSSVEI